MKKLLHFQGNFQDYFPISVSLILFCLSWHKEIRTLGSAQYRGASVFSVEDKFHSLCLTLSDCGSAMEHEVNNFKEISMMCLRPKLRVSSSTSYRYHLVIFSYMHINLWNLPTSLFACLLILWGHSGVPWHWCIIWLPRRS